MSSLALALPRADEPRPAVEAMSIRPSPLHIIEPSVTISRPIIPMGDISRRSPVTAAGGDTGPFEFRVDKAGDLHWHLSLDDWDLTSPVIPPMGDVRAASFEAVVDVYVGLLSLFSADGLPSDNAVRCQRSSLIKLLGWCKGSKRGTPTGDQYVQLERALDYLRHANISSNAIWRQLETIHGACLLGGNLSVLQSWSKSVPLMPHRIGNAVAVEATFSREFAELMRHESGVVQYCAATYMDLSRGLTRVMYRHLEGLRAVATEPTVTVDAGALLSHLGSRRRGLEPSRMHEILDESHAELFAHGIIGDLPTWSTSQTGQPEITYLLESAPDLSTLLEQTALDYGVTASSAGHWAKGQTERFAQVLAAAVQGILTPTRSIGRMVRDVIEHNRHIDPAALPHFEPGRGRLVPRQRCAEFEFLESQYAETSGWLKARPTIEAALRRQYKSPGRPEWVVDGLVLLAARRVRRAETLAAWKGRVNRWE
jgi:hypothetical protein